MTSKNRTVALQLTTSPTAIYSVPDNYEAEVQSIVISSIATNTRTFTIEWYNEATSSYFALAKDVEIEGNTIVQATTPLWLVQGESVRGSASANSSVVVTIYVKEWYVPKQF